MSERVLTAYIRLRLETGTRGQYIDTNSWLDDLVESSLTYQGRNYPSTYAAS